MLQGYVGVLLDPVKGLAKRSFGRQGFRFYGLSGVQGWEDPQSSLQGGRSFSADR